MSRVTCPLCGALYEEGEGVACHTGCPFRHGCKMLACPHCGYEVPAQTRLTRWLSRWLEKKSKAEVA
jgi:hypothetical protein